MSAQDNSELPTRRSIRLPGFDYSQIGQYFVTVCTFDMRCIFGRIEDRRVSLSRVGEIANDLWLEIPQHFQGVTVDPFIVMPNHLHGIITITGRARHAVPLHEEHNPEAFRRPVEGSVPTIIRSYKSAVTKCVREAVAGSAIKVWQSNYFERVLRHGKEFGDASRYILENPLRWQLKKNLPEPWRKA
jgi:putative transposase